VSVTTLAETDAGLVATSADSMRNRENSSEPISRYGSGIGAQMNIDPRGALTSNRCDSVPRSRCRAATDRSRAGVRVVRRLVHGDDGRDLDRLEGAVVEVALQLRQRRHDLGVADEEPTRHPAIEKDLVSV